MRLQSARERLEDNIVRGEWRVASGWKDEDWESRFWDKGHSGRMTRFRNTLISGRKSSMWQNDANFFFPPTAWKLQMCFASFKPFLVYAQYFLNGECFKQ